MSGKSNCVYKNSWSSRAFRVKFRVWGLADNDDESLYNAIKLFVNDYNKVFVYQDKAAKRSLMFDVEKTMNEIYSIL